MYIVLRTIVIKSRISDQLILIRLVENLVEITQIKEHRRNPAMYMYVIYIVTGDNLPNYKVKIQRALSKWVHDYRMIQLCMMYI